MQVVRDFESLHHRMEFVRKFNGVSYYEDSKATNVGSVEKALESFDEHHPDRRRQGQGWLLCPAGGARSRSGSGT